MFSDFASANPSEYEPLVGSSPPALRLLGDPEVVAKAQRRKFTAEYKLGIVEEADHATDPGASGAINCGTRPTRSRNC